MDLGTSLDIESNESAEQLLDVTDSFKNVKVAGDLVMLPGSDLSEAISSIDLFNPKMDRGLLRYDGFNLCDFLSRVRDELLPASQYAQLDPSSAFVEAVVGHLECLFFTTLSGISTIDTIGTALILTFPGVICCNLLIYQVESLLQAAHTVGEIICRAGIVKPEEFPPSFFHLLEKFSTFFMQSFPHFVEARHQWVQYPIEKLRLFDLFNDLLRGILEGNIPKIYDYLDKLRTYSAKGCTIINEEFDTEKDLFIIPLVANMHGNGCVRHSVTILKPKEVMEQLKDFIDRLYHFLLLLALPSPERYNELARLLIEETTAPIGNIQGHPAPFQPLLRACYHAILDSTIFHYNPAGALTNGFSNVSDGCPRIVAGTLHILCRSLSRQRRSIHKLLSMHYNGYEHRHLLVWFVLTGFGLDLYSPWERIEAHWMIANLSSPNCMPLSQLAWKLFTRAPHPELRSMRNPYDINRFERRWEFIPGLEFHHRYCLDLSEKSIDPQAPPSLENIDYFREYLSLFLQWDIDDMHCSSDHDDPIFT